MKCWSQLRIWSHLLEKLLMEDLIFCAVCGEIIDASNFQYLVWRMKYFLSLYLDFESISEETVGKYFEEKDVFFSCMGTTLRQAGSSVSRGLFSKPYFVWESGINPTLGFPNQFFVHWMCMVGVEVQCFVISGLFFLFFFFFHFPSIFLLSLYLPRFVSHCLRLTGFVSHCLSLFIWQFLGSFLVRIPLRF